MTFAFDLISDLHVDDQPDFDWSHQATSSVCIVAGDVARDRGLLKKTLTNLGRNYQAVFYIDGNDEHHGNLARLEQSYQDLSRDLDDIPNVTYLQDQVVIINGVAILGTNGWYTYDWTDRYSIEETKMGVEDYYGIDRAATNHIEIAAVTDAKYLEASVARLQTHVDVKDIIIVTHFVPHGKFLEHDPEMIGSYRINSSVNSVMPMCLSSDTEHKIKTWCFGHYHWPLDHHINDVRYVCNPRGRLNSPWHRDPYYPVRVEI